MLVIGSNKQFALQQVTYTKLDKDVDGFSSLPEVKNIRFSFILQIPYQVMMVLFVYGVWITKHASKRLLLTARNSTKLFSTWRSTHRNPIQLRAVPTPSLKCLFKSVLRKTKIRRSHIAYRVIRNPLNVVYKTNSVRKRVEKKSRRTGVPIFVWWIYLTFMDRLFLMFVTSSLE